MGAIFHASSYLLQKLDSTQHHFLEEIGVDAATAFVDHNFAPPSLRRDIGVLGLLHKRVLGKVHPVFHRLLPFHADVFGSLRPGEHNKQLYGHILDVHFQHAMHCRSVFGMVYVNNNLPQEVVDSTSVPIFSGVSSSWQGANASRAAQIGYAASLVVCKFLHMHPPRSQWSCI